MRNRKFGWLLIAVLCLSFRAPDVSGQVTNDTLWKKHLAAARKAYQQASFTFTAMINESTAYQQARYVKAEKLFLTALNEAEKFNPRVATSLTGLADLYSAHGKYRKAEPLYQKALAIMEKLLGSEHPRLAMRLDNLAQAYYEQAKYNEAEPLYQRALTIREKTLTPEHTHIAKSLENLAQVYCAQSEHNDAEPLYRRALAIWENIQGPLRITSTDSFNKLVELYRTQSEYAKAESLLNRALAILEKADRPQSANICRTLNKLAILYCDQGKYVDAERLYQRAVAIWESLEKTGFRYPDLGTTSLEGYAALLRKTNRNEEAAKMEARAKAIRAQSALLHRRS